MCYINVCDNDDDDEVRLLEFDLISGAGMDVPDNQRSLFYQHMGHSAAINASIYQTPPAAAEILMVGTHLMSMDGRSIEPRKKLAISQSIVATVESQMSSKEDSDFQCLQLASTPATSSVVKGPTKGMKLTTVSVRPWPRIIVVA
jgi:hypothetical protein